MLSPKQTVTFRFPRFRHVVVALALLTVQGALAGCGFQPMYGRSAGGIGLSDAMASVNIAPIPGRVGQQLRNELIFVTTGGERPLKPLYRLDIALREAVTSILVKIDGDAQGQVFALTASFKLVRLSDNKVVLEGKSFGQAAFQKFQSIFANVRARRDAEDRSARAVATGIRTRVAAFLARPA